MPEVAILKTTQTAIFDRDGYVDRYITSSIKESDFEEISQQELEEAKQCIQFMNSRLRDEAYILIEKTHYQDVKSTFNSILAEIKVIKDKALADKKKREEVERKRQESIRVNLIEKKRKQLEKLKRELGEDVS
jgi:septum formation inhibitor MinC